MKTQLQRDWQLDDVEGMLQERQTSLSWISSLCSVTCCIQRCLYKLLLLRLRLIPF